MLICSPRLNGEEVAVPLFTQRTVDIDGRAPAVVALLSIVEGAGRACARARWRLLIVWRVHGEGGGERCSKIMCLFFAGVSRLGSCLRVCGWARAGYAPPR